MMESTGNPNGDSTSNVVEGWQRRLLQLDRRNNLLYFKPGRTATLIADHSPDEIASLLDSSPRGLTFDYAEPRSRPRGANRFQAPNAQPEESEETEPYVREGDLQSDCTPLELQRKLGNLKRRAREWQEEQGLSVLSLALGFLRWIDEDGEEAHAPLLLLPAQLDRASPRDAFILTEDDEDISHNTTLAVKLAEFGIEIPEFDSETQQPSDYFHLVLSLVASRKDWRIEDTVYLTTFAYSKLAMWRDLEGIRTEGTDHSIVRSFAGDSIARTGVSQTPSPRALEEMDRLDAGRLDDVLDIRDQHTVLPADYSQLIAITGAKSGTNMVIHGPPGTGKSQTIANIIATTIAEGKSVLFVSEKTAALDVVKRRLEEKNLDVFCLDMHSERGSKASVYEQLRQSVDDPRMVANLGFDYDTLASLRNRLNPTVRALHMRRTPLGMTVFQMHGRLADLRHVPHVGFEVPDVGDLTLERLTSILEISRRIAQRRWEFREHWTSRWWALRSAHPSLELANTIRRDMTVLTSAVRQLETDTIGTAEALGMRQPSNLDQVSNLYDLAVHLSQTPSVPDAWLEAGACARLGKIAQREADQQQTRQSHVNRLQTAFGEPVPEWDYRYLLAEVALQTPERELLQRLLGNEYSQRLVKGDQSAFDAVERLDRATSELLSVSADLASIFQVEAPQTLTGIEAHVTTAASIANLNPIPESWLLPGAIDNVISEIQRAQNFMGALIDSENQLFSKFEQSILDLVDQQMLVRYRTDHQSRIRRLFGAYKNDRNLLRSLSLTPVRMSQEQELAVVQQAMDISRRRREWSDEEDKLAQALGHRYRGRDTDWDAISVDVWSTEDLLANWKGRPTALAELLTDQDKAAVCRDRAASASYWSEQVRSLLHEVGPKELTLIMSGESDLFSLTNLLRESMPALHRLRSAILEPLRVAREPFNDLDTLAAFLEDGARLREIEREHDQVKEALGADFQGRFNGFDTDWNEIAEVLKWTEELQVILDSKRASDTLREHCTDPKGPEYYKEAADSIRGALASFDGEVSPLEERFDFGAGPWDTCTEAHFDDVKKWTDELSENADSASDWLIYLAAVGELEDALCDSVVDDIRSATDDAGHVPDIVLRRITLAWLDWVYKQEALLADFTSADYDEIRSREPLNNSAQAWMGRVVPFFGDVQASL